MRVLNILSERQVRSFIFWIMIGVRGLNPLVFCAKASNISRTSRLRNTQACPATPERQRPGGAETVHPPPLQPRRSPRLLKLQDKRMSECPLERDHEVKMTRTCARVATNLGPLWLSHCVQIRAVDVRSTEERRANHPLGIPFYDGHVNANRRPSKRRISTMAGHTRIHFKTQHIKIFRNLMRNLYKFR